MEKFTISLEDEFYRRIRVEARSRGISIQAFFRAVIIPEWVKQNITIAPTMADLDRQNNRTAPRMAPAIAQAR